MVKKIDTNKIKSNKLLFVFIFFLFIIFIARLAYLCLINYNVGSVSIKEFITNRNIKEEVLLPVRGSILDKSGNVLAQDVASYTIIAYLDESRSKGSQTLRHVKDKENTAKALEPLINTKYEDILKILNKQNVYQVEFGTGGKNLSQLEMEEIKKLNLPGIDFIKSIKRYYSNGDFASYTLGYTVKKDDWLVGELGIESYYNDILTGKAGYISYEKDKNGYKIPNGREYIEEADNGDDIYLTLDSNIQLFVENAVKDASSKTENDWTFMLVVDAKTGAILGNASTPSFDPNIRNMTSYLNPFVSYAYEPGSTMKTFTYMCAIEKGTYDGEKTFLSGSKEYKDNVNSTTTRVIKDWNKKGWGVISYDYGYAMSSNIGIANMLENFITKNDLRECLKKYGFGKTTGFTMNKELKGSIDFKYDIEAATAGYGQGITTTPIQFVQALTSIANNGEMLKPYIVSKIVDSDTEEIILENKKEVIDTVVSIGTVFKIKDLMRSVICNNSDKCTGSSYYLEGYDVIGKTGTAQIYDYEKGKYTNDVIYSFAGMFPYEDPEIIIYAASKKASTSSYLSSAVKSVITNVSKYLDISTQNKNENSTYFVNTYVNKYTKDVVNELKEYNLDVIVIGSGDKIIKQYPIYSSIITDGDKVFLLTNNYEKKMPNIINYSYKEATNLLKLMDISYTTLGNGYVYEQSINVGEKISDGQILTIKLKGKYG